MGVHMQDHNTHRTLDKFHIKIVHSIVDPDVHLQDSCACARFDLLHIMVDEPDAGMDREVANHIVGVHMRRDTAFDVPYTMPQIQNYIKLARTKRPELSQQVWLHCQAHAQSMFIIRWRMLRQ